MNLSVMKRFNMKKKVSLADFKELEKILKDNMHAKIPDSHWKEVHKMMIENGKRFEAEERALRPDWKTMNTPFDL